MKVAKAVRLVNELRINSRRSLTEMAKVTDTPLSTVFKTVDRLGKQGVIVKNIAMLDFPRIGYPIKAGIFLTATEKEKLKNFLAEHPSLNTLLRLSGDYDYYAELIFKDMAAFQDFLDELKQAGLAKKISTHFITDVKEEEFRLKESVE